MTRDELTAILLQYLESERLRLASVVERLGIPPTMPIMETVASNVSESGAAYGEEERLVSPLSLSSERRVILAVAEKIDGAEPDTPSALYEHYGERCNLWMFQIPAPSASTPSELQRQKAVTDRKSVV